VIVRCGSCKTQFDVPGPGRFGCPACGSVNVVREASGGMPPGPGGGMTAPRPPSAPPPPARPSPRIACPECEFTFIVGNIARATCPNCGNEVDTGVVPVESDS
jgi:DNA-directed RNA polymerase subunit RPC12/RpoP